MNIACWLARSARLRPDAPALLRGTRVLADYARFARSASGIAAMLRHEYGVRAGDRVAIVMPNCVEYLEALFGIWWAGAVAVPVNAKLHEREVKVILDDCDPALVLTPFAVDRRAVDIGSEAFRLAGRQPGPAEPEQREPTDLAWLFYTSGTTGQPKGVMLGHGQLISMSLCYLADVDDVRPDDATVYAAPMSHGAGLYSLVHVLRGARHVVPESGGFDAAEVLDLAASLRDVSMFAAPTMVRRLTAEARQRTEPGDGIKTVVYGGGPMYRSDIDAAIEVIGPRFAQIYGQGESPMTITALGKRWHAEQPAPICASRRGTVGVAHSAVSVRITGDDRTPLPAGTIGEIEVKGATVMAGYWNNPEATAAALRDGWLRTGDRGWLDEDGFLTLAGRSKELVISGGSNIYPREVEEALVAHPGVAEAAVIGVPDPEWGEIVVAFIVPPDGSTPDEAELDAHCLYMLARFKRPRRYVIVTDLPRNNYGKVVKHLLRAP